MEIKKLRSTSRGIDGTYANANHHAKAIIPFITVLEAAVQNMMFKLWIQGHNVHQFVTEDGRKFELVPIVKQGESYVGLQLRLYKSRSQRLPLMNCTSVSELPALISVMHTFSQPFDEGVRVGGGIKK